jgi:hypothetical protein
MVKSNDKMRNKFLGSRVFVLMLMLEPILLAAQPVMLPSDSLRCRLVSARRFGGLADGPITKGMQDSLINMVHREAIRFKRAFHPAFSKHDTLRHLDSIAPGWRERNPLCVLAPHLHAYRYDPVYTVSKVIAYDSEPRFYTNIYRIKKADRFVREAYVKKGKRTPADTIYEDVSEKFFRYDSLFTAFYAPKTGDCFMMGGNAFLHDIPLAWFHQYMTMHEPYFGVSDKVMVRLDRFNVKYFSYSYKIGFEIFELHDGYYWFMFDKSDIGYKVIAKIPFNRNDHKMGERLELTIYRRAGLVLFKDYKYYVMRMNLDNNPKSFEGGWKVEGVSEDEVLYLEKLGFRDFIND